MPDKLEREQEQEQELELEQEQEQELELEQERERELELEQEQELERELEQIMSVWIFDIETVPNSRGEQYLSNTMFTADANLSDPSTDSPPKTITKIKNQELREQRINDWKRDQAEAIKKSIMEKKQRAREGLALRWWTAKICCIVAADAHSDTYWHSAGESEVDILQAFNAFLSSKTISLLVGKESDDFDLPMLRWRLMANNLPVSKHLHHDARHFDVNKISGFSRQSGQRGKLEDYAFGLSIEGKLGNGADVSKWYGEKDFERIVTYCSGDVGITREIYRRYTINGS